MRQRKPKVDATPPAAPRVVSPESLEAKNKLLTLIPYDERVRRKHTLVFGFIVDWFHSDYGDALASVRHVVDTLESRSAALPHGKGLSRTQVHEALADFVEWGYLTREVGQGKRASRYVPAWNLVCVPASGDATSVLTSGDTGVPASGDNTVSAVLTSGDEDPSTRPGLQIRGLVVGDVTSNADPTGDGLAATPSGGVEDFDALWTAYGVRVKRADAKALWHKLAGGCDRSAIISAARAWRKAYDAQHREQRFRKQLATWLKGECWLEDPPLPPVIGKPSKANKGDRLAEVSAIGEPRASNDNDEKAPDPDKVTITAAETYSEEREERLSVTFTRGDGTVDVREIVIESDDSGVQERGQKELAAIVDAAGLNAIDRADDLIGRTLWVGGDRYASDQTLPYKFPQADGARLTVNR